MTEATKQSMFTLETDRLKIVRQDHNSEQLEAVFADKKTMELYPQLFLDGSRTIEQSLDLLEKYQIMIFPFMEKESGVIIGFLTLNNIKEDDKEIEIGYFLNSNYWGNGFAGEMVRGLLAHLPKLGWKKIVASLYSGNTASEKLLQNCGFILESVNKDKHTINGNLHDDIVYSLMV